MDLNKIITSQFDRIINIGCALDEQNKDDFTSAVAKANESLKDYKIFVTVKEAVEIYLPDSFKNKEFRYGIKHSFTHPCDYYFAWASPNYKKKEDYVAKTFRENVCLINNTFPKEHLDKIIKQEILRLFTGARKTVVKDHEDEKYFTEIDKKKVMKKREKTFQDEDYRLDINMDEHRVVTVNVGFDGILKEYAALLISSASKIYTEEFNISFKPVGFYEHKLPEEWDLNKEIEKIKQNESQKSELHVLFSGKEIIEGKGKKLQMISGQSYSNYGNLWVSVPNDTAISFLTLLHELGHAFEADHVYYKKAIMHPHSSLRKDTWMPKTKETILKNKFNKWLL